MGWRKGLLWGPTCTPLRKNQVVVDPQAGTISRGKRRHRDTRPVDGVKVWVQDTEVHTQRGAFGRPRYRATRPQLRVTGPDFDWRIPIRSPFAVPQAHGFHADWLRWRQSGSVPAR